MTTLRRLIGSSVVVGLASVSRRHERRSRMVVSRRSGKRPSQSAAWLHGRVVSRSASPPPGRTDEPGQLTLSLPVWPGAPCVCWPTRRCCRVGRRPVGTNGPNFCGTLGRCRRRPESGVEPQTAGQRPLLALTARRPRRSFLWVDDRAAGAPAPLAMEVCAGLPAGSVDRVAPSTHRIEVDPLQQPYPGNLCSPKAAEQGRRLPHWQSPTATRAWVFRGCTAPG